MSTVAYLTWFWLLRVYLAAPLGILAFMTPLFGVVLGVVLLGEHLTPAFLAGSALVLVGLLVVNGDTWLPFLHQPRRKAATMSLDDSCNTHTERTITELGARK